MTKMPTKPGGGASPTSSSLAVAAAARIAASSKRPPPAVSSGSTASGKASNAAANKTRVSPVVKRAASIQTTSSGQVVDPAKVQKVDAKGDVKGDAAGESQGATPAAEKVGQPPGRKRARIGDASGKSVDAPRPFASLPFYGDHKRAISSLSFAPSSYFRPGGVTSLNAASGSNAAPVLCASASADGTAKVWDLTRHLTDRPADDADNASSASSSPVGRKKKSAAAAANSGAGGTTAAPGIRLDARLTLYGHNRGINDVAWSPTAAYIATASDDKTLRLWSAETGDAFVEFRGHTNFVFSCRFNHQSNLLVSGSFDETVKLWDVRCGEAVATLPAHSNPVTGVDFNRDGTCIVSGSYDGLVRIWDTATGECLKTVYAEGNPPVGSVRFSPNGKFVLSGTLDSKLRLYDVSGGHDRGTYGGGLSRGHRPPLRGGRCAKTYAGHENSRYCAFAAFLSSNPRRQCVVTGSEDGRVYLYDLQGRVVRQRLEGHSDAVLAVDAHDSLELIGSGGMSNDKVVRFWSPFKADG